MRADVCRSIGSIKAGQQFSNFCCGNIGAFFYRRLTSQIPENVIFQNCWVCFKSSFQSRVHKTF